MKLKDIIKKIRVKFSGNPYQDKENYIAAHANVAWWEKHLNQIVIQETIALMGGQVADLGCNHGACSVLMAREGVNVVGVDLNKEALLEAERIKNEQPEEIKKRISFVCSSFSELQNFKDKRFSGAYMLDVFEHIYPEDRIAIFDGLKKIMEKGAYLMILTPYEHAYECVEHVDFFDCAKLESILESELGLEVVEIRRDNRKDGRSDVHDRINALVRF